MAGERQEMTISADNVADVADSGDIRYDPYGVELNTDPDPMFARIRENAPLAYNAEHGLFALSRYDDVDAALLDHDTFSSARGAGVEIITSKMDISPGTVIFEDPPIHRKLLSRIFTPRKVAALEPKVREFTARCLDPLVGTGRFDFVKDLGAQLSMRVIGICSVSRRRTNSTSSTTARCVPSGTVRGWESMPAVIP